MARLLFWMLFAVLIYAVVKNRSAAGRVGRSAKPPEAMVSCAACGLNVPQSEAVGHDGRWYCSKEHLERTRAAH